MTTITLDISVTQNKRIENIDDINYFFMEMSEGGFCEFNDYDESFTYQFISDGGKFEDLVLFIKFKHVQIFQLGLSLSSSFAGVQVNKIKEFSITDMQNLIPHKCYFNADIRLYRFYQGDVETDYYVICEGIEAFLQSSNCEKKYFD